MDQMIERLDRAQRCRDQQPKTQFARPPSLSRLRGKIAGTSDTAISRSAILTVGVRSNSAARIAANIQRASKAGRRN